MGGKEEMEKYYINGKLEMIVNHDQEKIVIAPDAEENSEMQKCLQSILGLDSISKTDICRMIQWATPYYGNGKYADYVFLQYDLKRYI